jgi:5'-3' exonuclease
MMRLHLVDGTYELFRAHYSKRPPHRAPGGTDAKATAGFLASMLSLVHDAAEDVTHIAIAFDNPIRSFRNDLFDGYKTEEGVPSELLSQFDLAEEAARALGIVVWSMNTYEADDALATGAARYGAAVDQVRILTPDKDLGQCLRARRIVQVDRQRQREIDEDVLRTVRGIGPASIPDFLALTGDTADGIPGLEGFGEKGAGTLLARYEHLENIPDDARAWKVAVRGADRLAATLRARRPDAMLYRRLATLVTDVPLRESLADLAFRGVPEQTFGDFCERLDLGTLRTTPKRWLTE